MSNEIDILNELQNTDLSTVQTGVPQLNDGVYEATVAEVKTRPNKSGTGSNLELKLTLNHQADAVNGGKPVQVQPGFPVFHTVSLVRTFQEDGTTVKYDPLKQLAEFQEATLGEKSGPFMPLEQYIGKVVTIRTKIEIDKSGQYGARCRIQRFIKKS